jgi:hypothetical protein
VLKFTDVTYTYPFADRQALWIRSACRPDAGSGHTLYRQLRLRQINTHQTGKRTLPPTYFQGTLDRKGCGGRH